eukprot:2719282-Prymnesium_polylepis.2
MLLRFVGRDVEQHVHVRVGAFVAFALKLAKDLQVADAQPAAKLLHWRARDIKVVQELSACWRGARVGESCPLVDTVEGQRLRERAARAAE